MDNNFNQQPVYQQAPQQPVPQQAPKQPSNKNMMAIIALGCSAFGAFMAFLGTTLTCSCSASKTFDVENAAGDYKLSAVVTVAIIGAIIAIAGIVLGIIAYKQGEVKLAMVAVAVGVVATMYAIIPTLTICGYNCSLDSASEDMANQSYDLDDFDWD